MKEQIKKIFVKFDIVNLFKQFVKFGLVGVLNTIVGLGTIFICMNLFKLDYKISNIIGYIIGVLNSFIFNKFWTFKSTANFKGEAVKFFAVFLVCFGIQFGFTVFFKEILLFPKEIATIGGMVIYTILGFFGNKIFTFKKDTKNYTDK